MSLRGRGSTGTNVKTVPKKSNNNRGKKLCEDGKDCKYQHEYQHLLEYYHSDDDSRNKRESRAKVQKPFQGSGRGRKLTTSRERQKAKFAPIIRSESNSATNPIRPHQRVVSIREARLQYYQAKKANTNQSVPKTDEERTKRNSKVSDDNPKQRKNESHIKKEEKKVIDLIDET